MKFINILFFTILLSTSLYSQNLNLLGQYTYGDRISDVWGYSDNGKEYALVGMREGFSILDVTNPSVNIDSVYEIEGASSTWRDIKTWSHYAYITNENDSGLLIVDMDNLPNGNLAHKHYIGQEYPFVSAHNIYIDENGIGYIFGADYGEGGAIILDLATDPWNPTELGVFDDFYLHDGMVRGDTLWGSAVFDGFNSAIDVTDKASPLVMSIWDTPNNFTHNCWISDDGTKIFTTDEVSGAYVASYDVSNLSNVVELDRYQSSPGSGVIPHNTHFLNDYLITSYYRDGITIADVSRPHNMVEVARYDTDLILDGDGFDGTWGAYPWLPSGNILATDIHNGLFVLGATYIRGAYVEGLVTDSLCGEELSGVLVEILSTSISDQSNFDGEYATGTALGGIYQVQFSKFGYQPKVVSNVALVNGQVTNVDVELSRSASFASVTGTVTAATGGQGVEGVLIEYRSDDLSYFFTTDVNGEFDKCNVISDVYDIYVGSWGYLSQCIENQIITSSNADLIVVLEDGYEDIFEIDMGWTVTSAASSGDWERGDPVGTSNGSLVSPEDDGLDCGTYAYVTGNGGGDPWNDDIDDGIVTLSSPYFDVSNYVLPTLSFDTWFYAYNESTTNPLNDCLRVWLHNGTDSVEIVTLDSTDILSEWVSHEFNINQYLSSSVPLKLVIRASDLPLWNVTEAGFDHFKIVDEAVGVELVNRDNGLFKFYPNPAQDELNVQLPSKGQISIFNTLGARVLSLRVNAIDKIDVSFLPSGTYSIEFVAKNYSSSKQFVK